MLLRSFPGLLALSLTSRPQCCDTEQPDYQPAQQGGRQHYQDGHAGSLGVGAPWHPMASMVSDGSFPEGRSHCLAAHSGASSEGRQGIAQDLAYPWDPWLTFSPSLSPIHRDCEPG